MAALTASTQARLEDAAQCLLVIIVDAVASRD
jgi:hypothetical protein